MKIAGVTLKDDNSFEIYLGYGCGNTGKYEIKDNMLICYATKYTSEGGITILATKANVIFTFDIIGTNLKLSQLKINDANVTKLGYQNGFSIGMTYSIK